MCQAYVAPQGSSLSQSLQKQEANSLRPHGLQATSLLSSAQLVMYDSLRPQGLQHARPPCPSPTPGACSNSCPSIKSVMPSNHLILCHPLLLLPSFLLLPLVLCSIRVFSNKSVLRIRWSKYWSFSFRSVLPMNIQDGFPVEYTGLILQSRGLSRVFSSTKYEIT